MNTPFLGIVEVKDETTQFSTVTLDANKASISVGGSPGKKGVPGAQDGHIKLLDQHGVTAVSLSANPGTVVLQDSTNKQQAYLGNGKLNLGGPGTTQSEIDLFNTRSVSSDSHHSAITIRSSDASIRAGGNLGLDGSINWGVNGLILVLDEKGNEKIRLDGGSGDIFLNDKNGKTVIYLNADAAGNNLQIQDASGKILLAFDNEAFNNTRAGLFLGGHVTQGGKKAGVMALRNDAGNDSIFLDGNTGDITLSNADCAEDFDIAEAEDIAPGTVMVLDQEGLLRESVQAYDRKVAGVVSGAGGYKPGIVLDKQKESGKRLPVALIGKVYCKVDAAYSPVEVGDLLTTSPTPGHAMRASDPVRAFGAVLGKALRSQRTGRGLIPILVTLQ